MGNTAIEPDHPTYIAQLKRRNGEKVYLLCPDHMPLMMDTTDVKICPDVERLKVYAFYLPYVVPYTNKPVEVFTIKKYKSEASQVVNRTHVLCKRDVEILQARLHELINKVEEDDMSDSSNQSSLTKIQMDPIHDFQ